MRRGARVKRLGGPLWVKPWQRGDSSRQAEIRRTCVEGQGGPWCRRRCSRGVGQGVRPVSLDPRRTGRPPVRVIPHGAGGLQAVRLRGRHRKASGPGLSTAPVRLEWPVSERQTGHRWRTPADDRRPAASAGSRCPGLGSPMASACRARGGSGERLRLRVPAARPRGETCLRRGAAAHPPLPLEAPRARPKRRGT